jgi:hypothetical protein
MADTGSSLMEIGSLGSWGYGDGPLIIAGRIRLWNSYAAAGDVPRLLRTLKMSDIRI